MDVQNVKFSIKGKELTIKINLAAKTSLSASGKSNVIATTRGNVEVPGAAGAKLGLNLYTKV